MIDTTGGVSPPTITPEIVISQEERERQEKQKALNERRRKRFAKEDDYDQSAQTALVTRSIKSARRIMSNLSQSRK